MRRREFLTFLGGASAAWTQAARAQQTGRLPTVGFVGTDPPLWKPWVAAFAQRMGELGWIEGRTVEIAIRWSEGRSERTAEIAAEFVALKVNVIVAVGPAAVQLKHATSVIPIVFPIGPDPVGSGLVQSLARPGGNVTGLSIQATELAGKRLELLRQVMPKLRRLVIVGDANYADSVLEMHEVETKARSLGLEVVLSGIRRPDDIDPAFAGFKTQADALYIVEDPLIAANTKRIIALALDSRLPTVFENREFVQAGGLLGYGPNFTALFRRSADYVDKILRGTKPAEIPVEQPTKFELAVNLKTAKALGLTVSDSFLLLADEVIE